MEASILTTLKDKSEIANSMDFAAAEGVTHAEVDAILKSLLVDDYVVLQVLERKVVELTAEGKAYQENGTPEFQYANALELNKPTPKADVLAKVGKAIA